MHIKQLCDVTHVLWRVKKKIKWKFLGKVLVQGAMIMDFL
jgi:hypothetical protein